MALRDFLLMFVVCFVWAAHTVVSKLVVSGMEIPPLFYAAIRFGIVGLVTLPWLLPAPRPTWRMVVVGFLMGGGGFALVRLDRLTESSGPVTVGEIPVTLVRPAWLDRPDTAPGARPAKD